ncbi:Capsule polysaccharide modification protein LipA [Cupriavidus taiwanensis]|uniref:Capsule polysaccharide modification protein LipA n=1 Tax=Cupriavidus taiwanensis TaxID=164546 RepID=A0A975XDE3_9BURK|nr:capsular polysaccharide biosynthesis protein [Cupriavidus taiwanensis]SOY64177.1 Capsule polysaccharide modification protein LipA [Cupriavidus taiwanensis]
MLGVFSRGIYSIKHLRAFLEEDVVLMRPALSRSRPDGVAAWGRRPSAARAEEYARKNSVRRFLRLEDGFMRSIAPGMESMSCSMVVDDVGIYYDATGPSLLEHLAQLPLSSEEASRADTLINVWRKSGISKYNHAPDPQVLQDRPYVLIIDQTANDASVQYGMGDADCFERMLMTAHEAYPDCEILVKEHPEVSLGRKRGYLGALLEKGGFPRVRRLQTDVHVVPLLRTATAVFTVTSQVGFEALLHGRPVHTFGMPFYAGWGLTRDAQVAPTRRQPITLAQLAFAALVRYTRYVDPHSGKRCQPEDAIAYLALQRAMRQQFPARVHAVGFSRWKRPILRDYLQGCEVRFHRKLEAVPTGATLLQWGRRHGQPTRSDVSTVTVEDGFLRSVGLGAHLVRPVSWVFDRSGIYYDATTPSELEELLATTEFDQPLLQRACDLRESVVRSRLTKYNVGQGVWQRPAGQQKVVLVVGQVESDASLRYGALGIRTNRELLKAVRASEPDAYLVYKPHPDVMAGLRGSRAKEAALDAFCDELVIDYPMYQLIDAVDDVHVLTSLAGFEALLRGKPVTTHGTPFYAGWGLTSDHYPAPRRRRKLTLDMLVAGTLILYPRYVLRSAETGFATPEQVVSHMLAWRQELTAHRRGGLRKLLKPLFRYWAVAREGKT